MQESLFHESLADAIRDVVRACGGSKVVGCRLWPEKAPEAASRLLLDCLNDGRPEKFAPEQVLLLMKLGRERNCHAITAYMAGQCGYEFKPVDPEDERAKLQREFIESTKVQARILERLERLAPAPLRSAA